MERSGLSSQYAPLVGDTSPASPTVAVRGGRVAVPGRGVTTVGVTVASIVRARAAFTIIAKSSYGRGEVIIGSFISAAFSLATASSLSGRAAISYITSSRVRRFVAG